MPEPFVIILPLKARSPNGGHGNRHGVNARRKKEHEAVHYVWCDAVRGRRDVVPALPVVVTLTRIAPRALDTDNLGMSMKAIRDQVSRELGLSNDNDARLTWVYAQARPGRGAKQRHAVRITVEART